MSTRIRKLLPLMGWPAFALGFIISALIAVLHLQIPDAVDKTMGMIMSLGLLAIVTAEFNKRWFHPEEVVLSKWEKWSLTFWNPGRRDFQSYIGLAKYMSVYFFLFSIVVNVILLLGWLATYADFNPLGIHFVK